MTHRLRSPQAKEQCESMGGKFIDKQEQSGYYYCQPSATCKGSCKTASFDELACGGPLEMAKKLISTGEEGGLLGLRVCSPNQKKLDKLLCDHVYKGVFHEGDFDSAVLIGEDKTPFWVCQRPTACKAECEHKSYYKAITCGEQTTLPCLSRFDEIYQNKCDSLRGTYHSGFRTSTVLGRQKFWHTCKANCEDVKSTPHETVTECTAEHLASLVCHANCGPHMETVSSVGWGGGGSNGAAKGGQREGGVHNR